MLWLYIILTALILGSRDRRVRHGEESSWPFATVSRWFEPKIDRSPKLKNGEITTSFPFFQFFCDVKNVPQRGKGIFEFEDDSFCRWFRSNNLEFNNDFLRRPSSRKKIKMSPQEFTAELSKTCHCCTVVEPSAQVGRQVMGRQAFGCADIGWWVLHSKTFNGYSCFQNWILKITLSTLPPIIMVQWKMGVSPNISFLSPKGWFRFPGYIWTEVYGWHTNCPAGNGGVWLL